MTHSVPPRIAVGTRRAAGRVAALALAAALTALGVGCGPEVKDPPPPVAQEHIRRAEAYLKRNKLDDATREVELAESLAPHSYIAAMAVGKVYARRGWSERAIHKFRGAEAMNPDLGTANVEIGRTQIALGQYAVALGSLDEAIDQNETLDEPHFLKGIAFIGLSRNLEATTAFRACLKKNPKRDDAYVYLGSIELMNGYYEQAEKQLRSASSINPRNAQAQQVLGQTYLSQKRYERAEEALRKAIGLDVKHADSFYLLGLVLYHQGRKEAARKAWQKTLQLDSKHRQARKDLAALRKEIDKGPDSLMD